MPFVVGIDQSATSSGVSILNDTGGIVHLSRIAPPRGLREGERLVFIRDALRTALSNYLPVMGVMEGYSYGSLNKKFVLGEVGGIVKLVFADLDIPLYGAAPTQLKKFVTGNGKSDKQEVIKYIASKWNMHIDQDDMADAYALARIALQIFNPITVLRSELEIIKNLTSLELKRPKRQSRVRAFQEAI